jgi:hypothetical protein
MEWERTMEEKDGGGEARGETGIDNGDVHLVPIF